LEDARRIMAGKGELVDSWSLPQVLTVFRGKKSENI